MTDPEKTETIAVPDEKAASTAAPSEEKCCCGCSLRTGCIIIAVLWAIISLILLLVGSTQATELADFTSRIEEYEIFFNRIRGCLITYAIVGAFGLVTSLSLLYGVITAQKMFIYPWLICASFIVVITLILNIVLVVAFFSLASYNSGGGGMIVGGGTNFGVMIYSVFTVLNHYLNLTKEEEEVKCEAQV